MRTLQIFGTFVHAMKSTFANLPFAFSASWPWMLLMFPLHIAFAIYALLNYSGFNPANPDYEKFAGLVVLQIPIVLLTMTASSSIAVNWHRYVLLDEFPQGRQRLRVDRLVMRYLGNFILIGLAFAGIIMAASMVVIPLTVLQRWWVYLLAPVSIWAVVVCFSRLLKNPQMAI